MPTPDEKPSLELQQFGKFQQQPAQFEHHGNRWDSHKRYIKGHILRGL